MIVAGSGQEYIDTVIFDIGNVLISFQWMPYMRTMFDEPMIRRVNRAIWGSGLWNEMDRGLKTGMELLPEMQARDPEIKEEIKQAFLHCGKCMHRMDYSAPWIRELHQRGFRTLYLSNYSHYVMGRNPDVLYFLPELDGGLFSCDVKTIKPERKIFEIAKERYSLNLEKSVFLDDNPENVRASRAFGLPAIRFTTYEETRPKLEQTISGSDQFVTESLPD